MRSKNDEINITELNLSDTDDIVGGAKVVENIDNNFLKTFKSQVCNCGKFEPANSAINFDICDNCKYAQAPFENSSTTYCTKQKISNI
ncbi:MAG: hypothetical protein ACI4PR_00050 [Acutalibacteraceae bacterium]